MNVRKIKIAIIEDNDIFRESMKIALNQIDDFEIVWNTNTISCIDFICEKISFDILILDITTSKQTEHCNLDLIHKIRGQCPDLIMIVLIKQVESCYVAPIVKAGANAVMTLSTGKREFEKQIKFLNYEKTQT